MTARHPRVGIVTCTKEIRGGIFQAAYEKYIAAISDFTDALPVLIVDVGRDARASRLVELVNGLDGLLLTGGPSCINPERYREQPTSECGRDDRRDQFVFDLLDVAVEQDLPTLGICLGAQELNVSRGGSLHQELHSVGQFLDHRSNGSEVVAERYGVAHNVSIERGGIIDAILPEAVERSRVGVNSLHRQGMHRLGSRVRVEATCEDGLVEAISIEGATFMLGVQWHLEWMLSAPGVNRAILDSFAAQARRRMLRAAGGSAWLQESPVEPCRSSC